MFLDDELIEICKNSEADTPEKIQQLNVDICKKCEEYYKSRLKPTMTNKEAKCILNKTFNLFDSFVRMTKKSDDNKIRVLGELFEKHTYKLQFLKTPDMERIYNQLN